jgi:Asp-tRNA(Asn)/Glu-tRNA(Gln) amidotransferase A subunit family amidase
MTATVKENAALYLALAGTDERDPYSVLQPAPHLHGFDDIMDLKGVKVGVYRQYFQHGSNEAVQAAQVALDALVARGAEVVDIEIAHLQVLDRAHKITIMSEFANTVHPYWLESYSELSMDTHAPILLGRSFAAKEYIAAQKLRRVLLQQWDSLFESTVDVIITPTTAIASPVIEHVVDTTIVSQLMRFITASNFLGMPSITVPVGYTNDMHLPLGVQLIARHWQEHKLFRLANAIEHAMLSKGVPQKPDIFFDIRPKK